MIRYLSVLAVVTLLTVACNNETGEENVGVAETHAAETHAAGTIVNPVTTIQWVDTVKNIGKVSEGEKVQIEFKFVNTGTNPLVINNVVASCGCTIAEKPEAPVAPGKEGYIKASFDSKGRIGSNHKTLTVYANTAEATYPLVFDVDVVAKN